VATFSDIEKAEPIVERLNRAGIHAELFDESNLQKYWFISKPLGAEKVRVEEKDFERARELLEATNVEDHVLSGEILCPQCGSPRVEYPQFTRKFMTTTLVEVLCFLHVIDKGFYCETCHHTWPVSDIVPPKLDRLNWPVKKPGTIS